MSAEDYIRADRDGWKLRCEMSEKELAEKTKRSGELEAVLLVCEKLGMVIEDRPAFEGFAIRNLRAQQAEEDAQKLERRIEALEVQLESIKKQRNAATALLDEVSALTNRKGGAFGPASETVVQSVKRVVDELTEMRRRL